MELGGVYVLSGVMSGRVNSLFECLCVNVCVCVSRTCRGVRRGVCVVWGHVMPSELII